MSNKFYDIEPGDGIHYVCENGVPIAECYSIEAAELVRDGMMSEVAQEIERGMPL